jgi:hypothetical protein
MKHPRTLRRIMPHYAAFWELKTTFQSNRDCPKRLAFIQT